MVVRWIFLVLLGGLVGRAVAADSTRVGSIDVVEVSARVRPSGSFVVDSLLLGSMQGSTMADLLRVSVPVVVRDYGRGAQQSVVFRGTSPQHTSLYWNGLRLNSVVVGDVDFSVLPSGGFDALGVLPGASAVAYDNGALGGVVDMRSVRQWGRPWSVDLDAGAGSFGTYSLSTTGRVVSGRVQSTTRFLGDYSDNDFEFLNRDVIDPSNPDFRPTQRNENGEYRNLALIQDLFVRLGDGAEVLYNQQLQISVMATDNMRNLPQLTTYEGPVNSHLTSSQSGAFRGVATYSAMADRWAFSAMVGGVAERADFLQEHLMSSSGDYADYIDSRSHGGSFQSRLRAESRHFAGHTLFAEFVGGYYSASSVESVRGSAFDADRGEYSVVVGGSSRWGRTSSSRRWGSEVLARLGVNDGRVYGTGSVAVDYRAHRTTRLYLRGAYNERFPTLQDMYYTPGGNPDLLPERGVTAEFGVDFSAGGLGVQLNGFASHIHDWIMWLPSHSQYWSPQNLSEVLSLGVELQLSAQWRFGTDWRASVVGNFTLSRTVSIANKVLSTDYNRGQQLPFVPLVAGSVSAEVGWRMLDVGWRTVGEGQKFSASSGNSASLSTISAYVLHTLYVRSRVGRKVSVGAECSNIFDSRFYGIMRRPMAPRAFMFRFGLRLGEKQ